MPIDFSMGERQRTQHQLSDLNSEISSLNKEVKELKQHLKNSKEPQHSHYHEGGILKKPKRKW